MNRNQVQQVDEAWGEERRRFLLLCAGVVLTAAAPGVNGSEALSSEYPEAAYYRALPED